MATQSINVIGIAGSLRKGSYNRGLIRAAQELAPPNLSIEPFDLRGVPFYDGDLEEQGDPTEVRALKDSISSADALLLATPEYNAGIPAPLKNAIDWASRSPEGYRNSAIYGKPVAIMGGGGGGGRGDPRPGAVGPGTGCARRGHCAPTGSCATDMGQVR